MNQAILYPVNLDLREKKCVVVGGGKVAERKVKSLVGCQAKVFVISPSLNKGLDRLLRSKKIFHLKKSYTSQVLKDAFLVIAATNDSRVNTKVASDASRLKVLVNVVDYPSQSNFWVPAIFRRGPLVISISTSGNSPYLARRLKTVLGKNIGPEYAGFLRLLGAARGKIRAKHKSLSKCKLIYNRIINSSILNLLKKKKDKKAKELLYRIISG